MDIEFLTYEEQSGMSTLKDVLSNHLNIQPEHRPRHKFDKEHCMH